MSSQTQKLIIWITTFLVVVALLLDLFLIKSISDDLNQETKYRAQAIQLQEDMLDACIHQTRNPYQCMGGNDADITESEGLNSDDDQPRAH